MESGCAGWGVLLNIFRCFRREMGEGRPTTLGITGFGMGATGSEARPLPRQTNSGNCGTRSMGLYHKGLARCNRCNPPKVICARVGDFPSPRGPQCNTPCQSYRRRHVAFFLHSSLAVTVTSLFFELQNLNVNCRVPVPPHSGFFILFRLPIDIESGWRTSILLSTIITNLISMQQTPAKVEKKN